MDIQLFNYGSNAVRTIEQNGEVWFVAKDVCDILEIVNARDAIKSLDDDEKMTVGNSDGHSGQRGGAQFFNVTDCHKYSIDSGAIGLIPLELLSKKEGLGAVFELPSEAEFYCEDGIFDSFLPDRQNIYINTRHEENDS